MPRGAIAARASRAEPPRGARRVDPMAHRVDPWGLGTGLEAQWGSAWLRAEGQTQAETEGQTQAETEGQTQVEAEGQTAASEPTMAQAWTA